MLEKDEESPASATPWCLLVLKIKVNLHHFHLQSGPLGRPFLSLFFQFPCLLDQILAKLKGFAVLFSLFATELLDRGLALLECGKGNRIPATLLPRFGIRPLGFELVGGRFLGVVGWRCLLPAFLILVGADSGPLVTAVLN